MNYHIITQDKFFNRYIEDIYDLHLEDENVFWVQGNFGDYPYLTTSHKIEYLTNDKEHIINRLKTLSTNDCLFVSWYCGIVAQAILESKIRNPLYVYLMGGEFYADPIGWHNDWLYDRKTHRKLKQIGYIPTIKWTRRNPLNWWRIIDDIKRIRYYTRKLQIEYKRKLLEIERIDYVVLPKQANDEYELLKRLYPTFRAKHVYGLFDQNFDLARNMTMKSTYNYPYRILLGNSADPTNNHIDVMDYVDEVFLKSEIELFTALSYGDKNSKKWVIDYGKKKFGEHFHPIVTFMDRQVYLDFLNSMDVVIMFHNRQQAVGNIMTALVLGKPVFMKSTNAVYKMLKKIGITTVYDVRTLSRLTLSHLITEAMSKRAETICIIEKVYSKKMRLKYLDELLAK